MHSVVSDWFDHWFNKYAVLALSAMVGLFGYEWICWSGLAASDWGTWVAAIGTIGTLIGTIWLATTESRERKREQIDHAIVAAASVRQQIVYSKAIIRWVLDGTTNPDMKFSKDVLKVTADHLRRAVIMKSEEITLLVAAGNRIATDLAKCKARLEWAISALDMAASMQTITAEQCKGAVNPVNTVLLSVEEKLPDITKRIDKFLPDDAAIVDMVL